MNQTLRDEERIELNYAGAQKCDRCKTVWPAGSDGVKTVRFADGERIVACEDSCYGAVIEANDCFECVGCGLVHDDSDIWAEDENEDLFCKGCV